MIDLAGYTLTFDDEFNTRSISQNGGSTTWADIRPTWRMTANADIGFGTSAFVDAASGIDPFAVADGALTITARPASSDIVGPGTFASGLLHTESTFSQTYGYFEMRADLPEGAGVWPAFWMLPADGTWPPELDVVEAYGGRDLYGHVHTAETGRDTYSTMWSDQPGQTTGYHTYGALWTADSITFTFDGRVLGSQPTPADMHGPMFMLIDLAVSAGTPAGALDTMKVDYVRAYSADASAVAVALGAVSSPDGADTSDLHGAVAATVASVVPTAQSQPAPTETSSASSTDTSSASVTVTTATHSVSAHAGGAGTVSADTTNGAPATELLWRHTGGDFTAWSDSGGTFTSKDYGVVDTGWHLQVAADLDGDGRTDLLWRQDGGAVTVWSGTASGFVSHDFGVVDTGWSVAGSGDVDGDGRADVLWSNANGDFAIWRSTGDNFSPIDLGPAATGAQIKAVGDFDGDGRADVFWQDAAGTVSLGTSTGTAFASRTLGTVSADWHLKGAGDFDGDGRADLLWQNTNGILVVWRATGDGFASREVGGTPDGWHIGAVADVGGDGKADIVWRHDGGALNVWQSTGMGFEGHDYGVVGTDWHLV